MTAPKPFQQATVDAVVAAFRSRRRVRRFLVADEVGLGKTVVAQRVIARMTERLGRPFVVFYMCSNLTIARQNRRKLLEILPAGERHLADCPVDRLSLLPVCARPTHPKLNLYSLTPDTSIPIRKGQRRDGRQEERALVQALVEREWPQFLTERGASVFQRSVKGDWASRVEHWRSRASGGATCEAFRRSVREEFALDPGQHLLPAVRDRDELDLIAHFRNALAASAVESLRPDLVIFDEFQRFGDLFKKQEDEAAQRVIGRLLGDDVEDPPALLFLSATPYRLFTRRWEEESGASHRSEFFDLVEFLYGGDAEARRKRQECEAAFARLEGELRKGQAGSAEATSARLEVEALLLPVIARTERASHGDGWDDFKTETLDAPLSPEDLRVFKHLSRSFDEDHRATAVPYWTSIPMPMQTMGAHYVAWKSASTAPPDGAPALSADMRDRYEPPKLWPHPRLRALQQLASPRRLAVPWIAPTAPWWPLRGVWKNEKNRPQKLLLFSRFRAVPQAIAAALSFALEAELLTGEGLSYAEAGRRRLLTATESRHPLLALFHPSPLLVESTEPLAARSPDWQAVRREVRRQLKEALADLGVVVRNGEPVVPVWQVLARLENKSGSWRWGIWAWRQLQQRLATGDSDDAGLAQLLTTWDEEAKVPVAAVSPQVFERLVDHALGSPGVALGRALRRHWGDAVSGTLGRDARPKFYHTLAASWAGLRNYLDQRWFYLLLRRGGESYPDALQRAVIDGNLEAVLDEHLWITSRLRSASGEELATELLDGFSLKSGLFYLHPIEDKGADTFSVRCHAAMPFVQARIGSLEGGEKPIRTDELRRAFNTPFWPHVLATTSVGQEGLDFHAWCDTLVHWDLCRNPVDLEQREGRIQRFGGLSIRRAVSQQLDGHGLGECGPLESPWQRIEALANQTMGDASGLAPWWVCKGGAVKRYVFDVPTSEQRHWLHWMKEQRLLYRLALGQPNQEDLVEVLAGKGGLSPQSVRDAVINLSPWFRAAETR